MTLENLSLEELCDLFGYVPKCRPINTIEVSEITHIRPKTLELKRVDGSGPRFFSPPGSRKVVYAERDVLAWLASGARKSTSEKPCNLTTV